MAIRSQYAAFKVSPVSALAARETAKLYKEQNSVRVRVLKDTESLLGRHSWTADEILPNTMWPAAYLRGETIESDDI